MIPQDTDLVSFVEPDALLAAVADFTAATAWSGRRAVYDVPDTRVAAANDALGRAADLLSKLPERYSGNFATIAGAAMQGAVDAAYVDGIRVVGETEP